MAKLTKAQQDVIDKMKNGWELGRNTSFFSASPCWIQEGGIGYGGKSQNVSLSTFMVLWNMELIESNSSSFPTETYHLTAKAEGKDDS